MSGQKIRQDVKFMRWDVIEKGRFRIVDQKEIQFKEFMQLLNKNDIREHWVEVLPSSLFMTFLLSDELLLRLEIRHSWIFRLFVS